MTDYSFDFKEAPFAVEPELKFLYLDRARRETLGALITHLCDGEGPLLLVGEVGLGKTMMLRRLAEEASAHDIRVFMLATAGEAAPSPEETLGDWIAHVPERDGRSALLLDDAEQLPVVLWHRFLATLGSARTAENAAGRRPPSVIAIPPNLLEWLNAPLALPGHAPLGPVLHLQPFAADDVARYIRRRLRVAGGGGRDLIPADAIMRIAEASDGVPLSINRLATTALAMVKERRLRQVSRDIVDTMVRAEVRAAGLKQPPAAPPPIRAVPGQSHPRGDPSPPEPVPVTSALDAVIAPASPTNHRPGSEHGLADAGPGLLAPDDHFGTSSRIGSLGLNRGHSRPRRRRSRRLSRWTGLLAASAVAGLAMLALLGYRTQNGDERAAAVRETPPAEESAAQLPSSAASIATGRPVGSSIASTPEPPPRSADAPAAGPAPVAPMSATALPRRAAEDDLSLAAPPLPKPPGHEPLAAAPVAAEPALPAPLAPAETVQPPPAPVPRPAVEPRQPRPQAALEDEVQLPPTKDASPRPARKAAKPASGREIAPEPSAMGNAGEVQGEGDVGAPLSEEQGRPRSVKEIISMGDEFREAGDTEWARKLYRAAEERGSAQAAKAIGETYDPLYVAASEHPDPAEARRWYRQAAQRGDRQAAKRLEDLDAWMLDHAPQ